MRTLRAYPTLLRVGFAEAVAYRAELVVWILATTMPLVSLALWSEVAEGGPVGRFDRRDFAAYFLTSLVVRQLTGSWLVWRLNEEIKTGAIAQRLLKPVHPLVAYSAEDLALVPLRALISLPILAATLGFAGASRFGHVWHDAGSLAIFFASLLGAWLINYFAMAIMGSLAFFIESGTAVFDVWFCAFMLLSGYLLPLELFPASARRVIALLPFRFTLAYPVELATGLLGGGGALRDLGIQWAYVVFMGGLSLLVWRAGLRRFAAFGG